MKPNFEQSLEHWPVDRLIPYARNPRKNDHAVERVASAIKEFGFRVPIVAKSDGTVIDGHLRLKAAKKLGLESVPVITADDMTPTQIKAFRISVNRMAELAEWDTELLKLEMEELRLEGYDLDLTGFDTGELLEIMAGEETTSEGNTDEDEAPEAPINPVSKIGDIWVMGSHRVMCGDSTCIDSAKALMAGGHADLLVTDPPYNVAYEGKTADALTIKNDSMTDSDFRQFLRDCYATADAVMRPGASFYIWHADSEGFNFRAAAADVGWNVRQCLIWNKNTMVMGRQDYQWKHESCLYGWKDGAAHSWFSDRKQTTVLEFDKPHRNGEHPTMKPVELIRYQVKNSSKPGHTVLDLFGGSGTTLIACEMTGRSARLMELDPKYCDVIVRRWQDLTGKMATLESTGKTFNNLKAERPATADAESKKC